MEEQKILGVLWNFHSDQLVFDLRPIADLAQELEPTKRHVVSIASKFYDPIGFVSPITICFKMAFQELCEEKIDWDEPLSGSLLTRWRSMVARMQEARPIMLPRFYLHGVASVPESYSLQGFCDASTRAYAAVVYLLVETPTSRHVRFVAAKTRVAPTKPQTIPRLELLSALLLARLITTISKALEPEITLNQPTCFSDSEVSLYWIKGVAKEWKQFVQRRVEEIRALVPPNRWKHCPGTDNPADLPSRGVSPTLLAESSLWRAGPLWLKDCGSPSGDERPHSPPDECLKEMKKKDVPVALNLIGVNESRGVGQIINCSNYSTLRRLLRTTAIVMKFVKLLRRGRTESVDASPSTQVNAEDIQRAETLWMKAAQASLVHEREFGVWETQFGLFRDDDGVWRCGGRLANANLPFTTKHPALLDRRHVFTTLVVKDAHERVFHNGTKETLTQVRTQYWIVKGRSFIRQIIRKCVTCRRYDGLPHHGPPPPPLPEFRVTRTPPFAYTGVDFAGPLYTQTSGSGGSSKVWMCLYTCCTTRAVHLDLVQDMNAHSFIRCLKRFTARRGLPHKMLSNNAITFKSAAKMISATLRHPDVQRYFADIGIKWSFNLEKAPWWGGIFERMVKCAKRCLKKVVGRASLTYDELLTVVTEVEMILNSRPISYVSTEDVEEPLTPSHLLIGRRIIGLPNVLLSDSDLDDWQLSPQCVTRRMNHLNTTLDHFWRRWSREYLLELRETHRHDGAKRRVDNVSVGDIVLVHDEKTPRALWRLGRVEQLIAGVDGYVRGAVIRVPSGKGSTTLRRPLQRLYPLELHCDSVENQTERPRTPTPEITDTSNPPPRRSQRLAAHMGRDRVAAFASALESDSDEH